MTYYTVNDATTKERDEFYTLTEAKRWMRERMKQGHEVSGSKTKVWANGDFEPCGPITITGHNRTFMANAGMAKANY